MKKSKDEFVHLTIEFVPGICCAHEWRPSRFPGHEECAKCPATCNRGKDGKIEHYSNSRVDYAIPKLVG
jgi:hypothetical protein